MKATAHKNSYVIDAKGQKQAVLLDMAQYQQMLEDLHDLRVVAERKHEQKFSFPALVPSLLARGNLLEPPLSKRG